MGEWVGCTVSEGVACVTLDRPETHNAFNEVMMEQITDTFSSLGRRDDVRVVVLAAAGRTFSAGADVGWMRRMVDYSFDENVADSMILANMLHSIHVCAKPVIARIHGAVYGGGVGLTAACDMAVALSSATFCLSEVKLGIVPAVISPFVLEKIGMSALRRYALTAERFDAAEAYRIGLVSEVVETPEQMDAWIAGVSTAIKGNGPEAVGVCKAVLRDVRDFDWDKAAMITTKRISERRVSDEGQEGLRAFLEKRPPSWNG